MPVSFCVAPANEPKRRGRRCDARAGTPKRLPTGGGVIVATKGFAGEEVRSRSSPPSTPRSCGPTARASGRGSASCRVRQWIESVIDTAEGGLSLELYGGHICAGVWTRVCQRLLALSAGVGTAAAWEAGETDAARPATSSPTTIEPWKRNQSSR
jgi:hypothetical protein